MVEHLHRVGDALAYGPDGLGRLPQCELIAFPAGRAAVWVQAVVERRLSAVDLIDNDLRFGEAGRWIAALVDLRLARERAVGVDRWRVWAERGVEVWHERQRLIVDVDQAQRIIGDAFGLSGDGSDLIADEAEDRIEQQALLLVPAHVRTAGRAEARIHAGERFSSAGIDAANPGVRVRTPQHARVELARQALVVGIPRPAGDLLHTLNARIRLADDLQRLVGHPRPHVRCLDGLEVELAVVLELSELESHACLSEIVPRRAGRRGRCADRRRSGTDCRSPRDGCRPQMARVWHRAVP